MTKYESYLFEPESKNLITRIKDAIEKDSRYNSIRQWLEIAAEEKLQRDKKSK